MSRDGLPTLLSTVRYDQGDGIARVTLDRPEVHNAFDATMQDDLEAVWRHVKTDPEVRVVVLTGAGERAFCTGLDRSEIPEADYDPYTYEDPGRRIGPKSQGVWKPVVAAVNGMACGGAFYLLGESDVILASSSATFFDPHVSFGMTAVFEPLLLMARMPFGEVARMALVGNMERVSAAKAEAIGLVSEVVEPGELADAAGRLAAAIAAQPPHAVQATLRTLWAARDVTPQQAIDLGNVFLQLGTSAQALAAGNERFASGQRPRWRLR
ncbi:MAG TPA: enoyl-CoA hydratase/isomerase family protein [Acidimicrobiales bacterium]|nr:enoyl-CoA hydratase/isomerase family protein [Acidimicrobiales bacterium]